MNNLNTVHNHFFKAAVISFSILLNFQVAAASSNDDSSVTWKAELSVGLLDDSNVAIDELDQNTTQGDSATTWSAKVGSQVQLTDQFELRASASLRDKSFHDFDQFDLRTSLLSLQSSYDFSDFKLGGGVRYISTDLASESFLSNQHLYAFATHRLNKQWFFRGELNFADKEFDLESSRDTSREQIGLDAFYFLDDTRKYWTLGFKFSDEQSDTNNDQFSRDNSAFKIKYSQELDLYQRDIRVDAEMRYQARDYGAIDPRIGEVREDDRYRAKVSAHIPIKDNWFMLGEYEYSDYSSNLPSADYSQSLFTIQVGWSLE